VVPTMPALYGSWGVDARDAFQNLVNATPLNRLVLATRKESTEDYRLTGRIIAIDPAPGTPLTDNMNITITVANWQPELLSRQPIEPPSQPEYRPPASQCIEDFDCDGLSDSTEIDIAQAHVPLFEFDENEPALCARWNTNPLGCLGNKRGRATSSPDNEIKVPYQVTPVVIDSIAGGSNASCDLPCPGVLITYTLLYKTDDVPTKALNYMAQTGRDAGGPVGRVLCGVVSVFTFGSCELVLAARYFADAGQEHFRWHLGDSERIRVLVATCGGRSIAEVTEAGDALECWNTNPSDVVGIDIKRHDQHVGYLPGNKDRCTAFNPESHPQGCGVQLVREVGSPFQFPYLFVSEGKHATYVDGAECEANVIFEKTVGYVLELKGWEDCGAGEGDVDDVVPYAGGGWEMERSKEWIDNPNLFWRPTLSDGLNVGEWWAQAFNVATDRAELEIFQDEIIWETDTWLQDGSELPFCGGLEYLVEDRYGKNPSGDANACAGAVAKMWMPQRKYRKDPIAGTIVDYTPEALSDPAIASQYRDYLGGVLGTGPRVASFYPAIVWSYQDEFVPLVEGETTEPTMTLAEFQAAVNAMCVPISQQQIDLSFEYAGAVETVAGIVEYLVRDNQLVLAKGTQLSPLRPPTGAAAARTAYEQLNAILSAQLDETAAAISIGNTGSEEAFLDAYTRLLIASGERGQQLLALGFEGCVLSFGD